MSKTLSLKKSSYEAQQLAAVSSGPAEFTAPEAPKAYTADELRAMLAAMNEPETPARVITDLTMDLSIDSLPAHVIADKSLLPPVDERTSSFVQAGPGIHGKFGINGIPLIAPGVDLTQNINPATGQPYAQTGVRPATQIQAPPQNFSRRRG